MIYEKLYPFQKDAAHFVLKQKNVGLFADTGVGKTWITVGAMEKLADDDFAALLVVPLANIVSTWETIFKGTVFNVTRNWNDFKAAKCPKVLLVHYQGLSPIRGKPKSAVAKLAKKVIDFRWSFICYDESQKIKSRSSSSSRIAGRIKESEYRLILTATPFDDLTDDPQEIWAQCRFMNPDIFGKRWGDYEDNYLKPTGYMGYKRAFRTGKLDKVLSKIKPYVLRISKEDVLDLPPLEIVYHPVPMYGTQKRLYGEMKKTMMTTVNGVDIVADLVITQLVKLQQISGGFIKDEDEEIHSIGRAKLRKLKRIVKTNEFPLVIFAKYSYEIAQIASELTTGNLRISTIEGKNRSHRTQTICDFQAGKIDILIAQIKTGGVGIDLQTSNTAIFYSTTFSYIDFHQAIGRVHRQGQTRPVAIHLLYVDKTVDKLIFEVLLYKRDISSTILGKFKPQKGDL